MKRLVEEIELAVIEELQKRVNEFSTKLIDGTVDADSFITMGEIENDWGYLRKATDKAYAEMVSQIISAIDEREIIRKKKENTES